MTKPATPLENKAAAIAWGKETRATIGLLIDQFIRPAEINNIELRQLVNSNARAIEATGASVRELKASTDNVRAMADDVADEAAAADTRSRTNESRFDVLLEEARADRQRSDERFAEQMQVIQALSEQNRALIVALANTNTRVDDLERAS